MHLFAERAGRLRRQALLLPGVLLIACLLLSTGGAVAAGRTAALCSFEMHETASPGWLLTTPTRGTGSGTGTISCVGVLDGRHLAARPGAVSYRYSYGRGLGERLGGDTCMFGSARGTWQVNLPTAGGPEMTFTGPFDFEFAGPVAEAHGWLGGVRAEFVFEVQPDRLDEDCVRKPFRHFMTRGQGILG